MERTIHTNPAPLSTHHPRVFYYCRERRHDMEDKDAKSRPVLCPVEGEPKPVINPGEAAIKPEYILRRIPTKQDERDQSVPTTTTAVTNGDQPPPNKKRKKERGQNKRRPRAARVDLANQLCPSLYHGSQSPLNQRQCHFGEKCRYCHDCEKFLKNKLPDISQSCNLFKTLGRCPYGLACRYGNSHMTADHQNMTNSEIFDSAERSLTTKNVISRSQQENLRKRKVALPKSELYLRDYSTGGGATDRGGSKKKNVSESENREGAAIGGGEGEPDKDGKGEDEEEEEEERGFGAEGEDERAEKDSEKLLDVKIEQTLVASRKSLVEEEATKTEPMEDLTTRDEGEEVKGQTTEVKVQTQPIGTVTDEDIIKLRPSEKRTVDFEDKLYLAPLTTVGNLPFRRVCKELGADITCGEMAMATNLLQGQQSEWALLKRHSSEDLFGVQICGAHVDSMTRCAEVISTHAEVDFIDINVGCPIDLVCNKGAGCSLMDRRNRFEGIVRGMTRVASCPITVKMRTGVHNKNWNAHKIMPKLREWGVTMATIHGRSREQRYTKMADWDYISRCAEAAAPLPVFGCGDVLSYEDYDHHRRTNVGIMIARGALIKPWIFTEIKERRHWDISSSERFEILKRYTNYGLEHWGSDTIGVENTRKFLLEWLSFLYRYIPIGLLETPPQAINQRPPLYRGRDDLETLMASHYCQDWIKISEMLLGPVPSNFTFLPKHKANSYTSILSSS